MGNVDPRSMIPASGNESPDQPQDDPSADIASLRGEVHASRSRLTRGILVAVGTLSVCLGILGILLPVVPTTPFLLLAAACYAHSSERFYVMLLTNRFFGHYIRDWRDKRGFTISMKLWIIFILVATMSLSALYVPLTAVKILLGVIGLCVSIYIWRLPTKVAE